MFVCGFLFVWIRGKGREGKGSVKCECSGGESRSECVELKRVLWWIHVLHGGE